MRVMGSATRGTASTGKIPDHLPKTTITTGTITVTTIITTTTIGGTDLRAPRNLQAVTRRPQQRRQPCHTKTYSSSTSAATP